MQRTRAGFARSLAAELSVRQTETNPTGLGVYSTCPRRDRWLSVTKELTDTRSSSALGYAAGVLLTGLGAVGLLLSITLPRGWPRVGFEGALVFTGLAFWGGAFCTLLATTVTALVGAVHRTWPARRLALLWAAILLLTGYVLRFASW